MTPLAGDTHDQHKDEPAVKCRSKLRGQHLSAGNQGLSPLRYRDLHTLCEFRTDAGRGLAWEQLAIALKSTYSIPGQCGGKRRRNLLTGFRS